MTTQPKFVPSEAAQVFLQEGAAVRVRMVDSVGTWSREPWAAWRAGVRAWCIPPGRIRIFPLSSG